MTVNDGWLISRVRATHRGNGLFVKGVVTLRWPAALSSLTHVICIVRVSVVFLRILLALQLFPNPGPRTLLLPQVTQNEQLFAAPQEQVRVNKMAEKKKMTGKPLSLIHI